MSPKKQPLKTLEPQAQAAYEDAADILWDINHPTEAVSREYREGYYRAAIEATSQQVTIQPVKSDK